MNPELPFISVVIPNYNHGHRLEMTLKSLNQQSYPSSHYEVLVVDNGSEDQSREIAVSHGARLHVVAAPKNPYVCRNAGMRLAAFDWIALLDSTCIPCANYLEELVLTQKTTHACLVAGNIQFEVSDTSTLGEIVDSLRFMRNREFSDERTAYPGGALFVVKSVLGIVGYFREDMRSGPDIIWTKKILRNGNMRGAYADKAKVNYKGTSFPDLLYKAHRDGWGQGIIAREEGRYHWLRALARMRPPGLKHYKYVLQHRGHLRSRLIQIWFGLWLYRIFYNLGYLNIFRSLSK